MVSKKLLKSARTAVSLAEPKKKERFLVVTDTEKCSIGKALFQAASEKCEALMIVMKPTGQHGREPLSIVANAMQESDIVYCATRYSLTHTDASRKTAKKKGRVATLPGITEGVLTRGMDADYKSIRKTNSRLAKKMKKAKVIRVKARKTEFFVKRGKRKVVEDGAQVKKGSVVNLPGGEVFFSPKGFEGYFTGTHGAMKNKTFIVRDGRVRDCMDSKLKKKIWGIKNARNIAEFAIGTNPGAKMKGVTLEDEKVLGTCHVAIGDSKSIGGTTNADIHWDFVIKKPDIWFDKEKIMEKGKLLI